LRAAFDGADEIFDAAVTLAVPLSAL